jgi:hypothetical protein
MGFAISWLAVTGKSPELVLTELGLVSTGEAEEIPESPITGARLPSGRFLVFANRFDSPLVSEASLRILSRGCDVVSCRVEEHVMFSSATCYVDGEQSWHVEHDAQAGIYSLESSGELPDASAEIFESLMGQQAAAGGAEAEVDYIHDAPISLAEAIVGFRHDQDIVGAGEEPFEVLFMKAIGRAKPWWKVW